MTRCHWKVPRSSMYQPWHGALERYYILLGCPTKIVNGCKWFGSVGYNPNESPLIRSPLIHPNFRTPGSHPSFLGAFGSSPTCSMGQKQLAIFSCQQLPATGTLPGKAPHKHFSTDKISMTHLIRRFTWQIPKMMVLKQQFLSNYIWSCFLHMSFSMISKILRIFFEKKKQVSEKKTRECVENHHLEWDLKLHSICSCQLWRSWSKGFIESWWVTVASFTRPPIIMVQWKWVYLQYDRFLSIFWVIFHEKPMIMGDFRYVFMGFMDLGSQTMLTESIMSYCDEGLIIIT